MDDYTHYRHNEYLAGMVVKDIIPNEDHLAYICTEFAKTYRYAKDLFPNKTFITLHADKRYIRLNVAGTESMYYGQYPEDLIIYNKGKYKQPGFRLVLDSRIIGNQFEDSIGQYFYKGEIRTSYIRAGGHNKIYIFSYDEYRQHATILREAHKSMVKIQGSSGGSYRRWHSPGLVAYLSNYLHDSESSDRDNFKNDWEFKEGRERLVESRAFSRSSQARKECIKHHGSSCIICGFNFQDYYGNELVQDTIIDVHHIVPISRSGGPHKVNPKKDLIPICPNCHRLLHSKKPDYTVQDIKEKLQRKNS